MRVDVGRLIKARPGDVVLIRARLPNVSAEANLRVRLSVWSRNPGFDFAPHIQLSQMGILQDGKPMMVPPMLMILDNQIENSSEKQISFIADELLEFRIRQEVDTAKDTLAIVQVKRYSIRVYRFMQWMRRKVAPFTRYRAKGLSIQ